jgi:hypothetical protein
MEIKMHAPKRLVPQKEARYRLGMGKQKFCEFANAGVIPIARVGGRIFVRSDVLDELVEHPERLAIERRAS